MTTDQKQVKKLLQETIKATQNYNGVLQNVANGFAASSTEDPDVIALPGIADTAILANRALGDHCRLLIKRMEGN